MVAGGVGVGEGGEGGTVGVGFYGRGVLGESYADAIVVHTVVDVSLHSRPGYRAAYWKHNT